VRQWEALVIMMMRNENNADISHIKTDLSNAADHTIAGIDNIKRAIDDQQI
jgi:hypothetical protein